MKSQSPLTENGVISIYNAVRETQLQVKVQVIYLSHWNMVSFLRVTDSKRLSPIMIILKLNEKFYVGDIILIKKVDFQPSCYFTDEEIIPFIDSNFNHIIVLEYQVVEKQSKLGSLFAAPISSSDHTYWNDLASLKSCLVIVKGDSETVFRQGEKRIQIVQSDCNDLREIGNDLFNQKNFNKAILHYEMAKQIDNYDAIIWNNSSQAFYSNEEFIKAKRDALVSLKLDPFNLKAYFRAARAMEKAGDITDAIEILEAGLYLCSKCEDIEKLLKSIKEKKEEIENLNSNASKKRIANGEYINSGSEANVTNGNFKKSLKPKDSPHKYNPTIKKVKDGIESKPDSSSNFSTDTLSQNKIRITSLLEGAKMLYERGKFKNALELYETAIAMWGTEDKISVVRYLIDVCKIKLSMEPLKEVKDSLLSTLADDDFPYPPAIHFWLASLYEILEDQNKLINHANVCLQLMQSISSNYSLMWPGTTEPIAETSPEGLKKWFYEGAWRPAPLARCRHVHCISIQNQNLAKIDIYSSDIDFRGYVEVECEELCSICYHPCCWKSIKEQSEGGQSGKKTDKDFLGLSCFTPDCSGKILSIRIFDETSQLKNEICKDKKEKRSTPTSNKLKKKKDKKKSSSQVVKQEDKKKIKPNDVEDNIKYENEIEIIREETAIFKPNPEEKKKISIQGVKLDDKKRLKISDLEDFLKFEMLSFQSDVGDSAKQDFHRQIQEKILDPISFEGNNYKVLRPNNDLEEFNALQAAKKNKNKKKKKGAKSLTQLPIGEEVEERFAHNEYLTRLRAMKSQREVLESDAGYSWLSASFSQKYIPECMLDPERPFYLPQHLQDNPMQLESILRAKMATASSSDIDKENITTLLEFMYDWLKAQKSPMLITDPRIVNYITENFPSGAVAYVNKCGGVKNFLLQSFRFALIDDVVCVNEHVVAAQDAAIHIVMEKFKASKFLISDGHRAIKLSHLIDDTKSTCSSNSSMSAPRATSSSLVSSESLAAFPKLNYAYSATPYKTAALAKMPQKEADVIKTEQIENKFIQVGQSKSSKQKMTRKPKLKTMDIDVFDDEIEPIDMGQLFSQGLTPNDKSKVTVVADTASKSEIYFHSDEELENDTATLQISNKGKQHSLHALKEKIAFLESELISKRDLLTKAAKEKEVLAAQNQELNDRFSQFKMKSSLEIAAWKKNMEDAQEQTKIAENNFECYRNQKEGEVRKLTLEKANLQEELKAYTLKLDSLQLSIDQLNTSKAQCEEENNQKSHQLTEHQIRLVKYKSTAETAEERARDAESKYLTVKRDLIKMNLEKTKKRLTAEVNKMQELLLDATDETFPTKAMLNRSIKEWEETIAKLNNNLSAVHEDCQKLVDCIKMGRSLSSLPPGDLQVPSVPDLTVANLLFIGKGVADAKASDKAASTSSSLGFLGLSNPLSSVGSSRHSQFGGLNTFSLGQLGVTPSGGSGPESSIHNDIQSNDIHRSIIGPGSGLTSGHMGLHTSRLADLGIAVGSRRAPDSIVSSSSGFAMNGVSPLSSFMGEEMNKRGSSDSSPISVPMPPMSLSGANEFTSTYSRESKTPNHSEPNHLFGSQLSWSFNDDHMKPITFGNQSLNIDAKEIKRLTKTVQTATSVLGQVSDLSLIPPSSTISSLHSTVQSPTINKSIGGIVAGGSAFGLQSLLEANSRAEPRTVATPTTPTATKPKFQNLRSSVNIGAIGALPPKVVRPIPRSGAAAGTIGTMPGMQAMSKDDSMATSAAYKRLIEGCKLKFGNEYPAPFIQKAIREVREQNKNSLSGLALETILEQVEAQLRLHKRMPSKSSVAPWAQLTQAEGLESHWQGPMRGNLNSISEDHCAICLEMLNSSPTMPLPCLHEFHIKCIKNWLMRKSDCPICRKFALNSDEFPSLSLASHGP